MKFKSFPLLLIYLFFLGCASSKFIALDPNFTNSNKSIGIIIISTDASHYREGGQGLLDMVVTAGEKYKSALTKVNEKLSPIKEIKVLFSDILKNKNKEFEFIEYDFDEKKFQSFQDNRVASKKYFKKDIRGLKHELGIDEIMLIEFRHGLLVSYYGFIELERKGFASIATQIIDLEDNSLLYSKSHEVGVKIDGKWNENEKYIPLLSAVENSIANIISNEKRLWE